MTTREVRSFCRICVAMCGIEVTVDDPDEGPARVVRVGGDADHPLSRGYTCTKGRALPGYHHHPDRLDHPSRRSSADLPLGRISWDDALGDIASAVQSALDEKGPESVALYLASGAGFDAAGRPTAERFLHALGSPQKYTSMTIDTPCKPLVAELVGGWSGLMPTIDFERADLVLLLGTNPVVSHGHSNGISDPVMRLRDVASRGGQVWVVDPRRTETAALAESLGGRHLRPRPSTDWMILAWLVRELLGPGGGADADYLAEHAEPEDLDTVREVLAPHSLETVTAASGVAADDLRDLLDAIRAAGGVSALTGTGTTMQRHANVTEWLVWVLHIVTGSYDRPGGMWFNPGFLRQTHERPPRSGRSSQRPGPASRPELSHRFGEYPCAALVSEIEAGNVRVLFVVGGNPLTTFPEPERLAAAFRQLDALVVVDVVETETTAAATHVLPATDQLERADVPIVADSLQTSLASQFTPAVVDPGAQRRPVWWMFAELARRLGLASLLPAGQEPGTATDETILAELLAGAALDLAELREHPTGVVVSPPLFGWVHEHLLPRGRWNVAPGPLVEQLRELRSPPEATLVLIPRRLPGTMNSQLRGVTTDDQGGIRLHPDDAVANSIVDGERAELWTTTGAVTGIARVDERIRPGTVSMTHGWSEPNTGELTSSTVDIDPLTGMVHQSGVPVRISPVAPR